MAGDTPVLSMLRRRRSSHASVKPDRRVIKLNFCDQADSVVQAPELEANKNAIRTSHYTLINFPFMNLYKQFHRAANVYFLLIMILQTWDEVSITHGDPSMAMPLAFVLLVTAIKDALEDISRHRYDSIENNRTVLVFERRDPTTKEPIFEEKPWSALKVGSIVKLKNRERIPADIALLACSDPINRVVYVMTAGLDGETNLKQRVVAPELPEDLMVYDRRATLTCDAPNKLLESFDATVTFYSGENEARVSMSAKNIILRGSQMRNSTWAIGVVVYAGSETKLQMNSTTTSFKTSSCMEQAQQLMLYIFAMQCLFCVGAAIASNVFMGSAGDYYYLVEAENSPLGELFLRFFNYVIIFTNFIPISLLVTIDMVKFGQGFFISWDLGMYHDETNRCAKVNCSELNEELGCIEHVFTDKTGTLTANIMKFKECAVNESEYCVTGETSTRIQPTSESDQVMLRRMFFSMAVNHAVIPEYSEDGSDQVVYSASSPDEGALVQTAKDNGYVLTKRGRKSLTIEMCGPATEGPAAETPGCVELVMLHNLEFSSDRKRSSVIVQDPRSMKIVLHCKGADNVIQERLCASSLNSVHTASAFNNLDRMATKGLRTLCIATRELDKELYEDWNERYHEANVALEDRKRLIAELQDEIEQELELIGCTGIEDKLQEHVPETISSLRAAGIKVWMLTGDKVDTAVNIGLSCALWTHEMHLHYLLFENASYHDVSKDLLTAKISAITNAMDAEPGKPVCIVIDTKSVFALTRFKMMPEFLRIANRCESVICARVSPDQKAVIVRSVRESDKNIKTLSIGDGANDVPMIQKAHVGVGIYGQEGLQAANAADFAIARFHFLRRLLFVHGRWSARRVGVLVCYMFYKNAILVLPQFLFAFFCLASGQNFYLDYPFYQGYNLVYTSFPILFFGISDQDVSDSLCLKHPEMYADGSLRSARGLFFSKRIFWRWIGEGFYQSGIITLLVLGIFSYVSGSVIGPAGHTSDIWSVGSVIHLCVCLVVTFRLLLENKSINRIIAASYVFSVLSWFLWCWLWSETRTVPLLLSSNNPATGVLTVFSYPITWHLLFLTCWIALLPSFLANSSNVLLYPSVADTLRSEAVRAARGRSGKTATIHPA